jgi:hypothetical protein
MVETALRLLDKLPDGAERLRAELALRSIEYMVVFVLYGNSSPEVERATKRMCELGEKIGEDDQLLRGLIPLSLLYFDRGESSRGLELSRRCLELAKPTQDAALVADALWAVGFLTWASGRLREAASNFEDGLRVLDRTRRRVSRRGFLYRTGFECGRVLVLQILGRVDEAVKVAEQGLRHTRESKHLFSVGFALLLRGGHFAQFRREPEIVRTHNEELIALSEEYGFASWLA